MGVLTKLEVIVNADVTDISDNVLAIHLQNDGFGIPDAERYEQTGPLQDGSTDLGFKLNPRSIQIVVNMLARSVAEYWQNRDTLLYLFTPRVEPIQLRFTRPDEKVRQIDCHYVGGLTFPSQDKQAYVGHRVGIQLRANDPTFYDPVTKSESLGIAVTTSTFTLPLSLPWNIGSNSLNSSVPILYSGTYVTHPIITVYGPVADLIITNTTTGDKLDFTGHTITAGKVYTIDTRYGYKTVTDELGTAHLDKLTSDSDLSTFSFVPRPAAPGGINTLSVSGTGATTATNIYISYYERYIGV